MCFILAVFFEELVLARVSIVRGRAHCVGFVARTRTNSLSGNRSKFFQFSEGGGVVRDIVVKTMLEFSAAISQTLGMQVPSKLASCLPKQ